MMASQTIKEKFVELKNSKQTPRNARPKIQRVADHLRNGKDFEKYYSPKFVSIGPIHHGSTNLNIGEKYKLVWASKYIENIGLIPEELHKKIADNIDELKGRFSDDVLNLTGNSLQGFGCLEEKLSWMLLVDGCSLLYILEKVRLYNDPRPMDIKLDQLVLLMKDVLLLENQLPYEVLKLLWKDNNENELIKCMTSFPNYLEMFPDGSQSEKEKEGEGEHSVLIPDELQSEMEEEGEGEHSVSIPDELQSEMEEEGEGEHSVSIPVPNESQLEKPTHLLDLQRKVILTTSNSKTKSNEAADMKWSQKLHQKIKIWSRKLQKITPYVVPLTYRNIQDLKAVGIRLKSSMTQRPRDIDFCGGWFAAELTLPMIIWTSGSAHMFLNLIAYEMCPDFENYYEICSFLAFMDSLIDNPEDVKELRSNGILVNLHGSDKEVADLFNMITTDLVRNPYIYIDVKWKINYHYCNKYKTWIAQGFHTYFNSPWAIIAFIAAVVVLVLTFIQTWFTIHPTSK